MVGPLVVREVVSLIPYPIDAQWIQSNVHRQAVLNVGRKCGWLQVPSRLMVNVVSHLG